MNILNFLDANVWLALLWSRHVHSERARAWFEGSSEEKFFFCRITQITVLRLLTTPMVMGSDVKTMSEAWALWDKVCADDRIALLAEPEAIEPEFRRFSALRSSSPKVWADACLVAFAAAAGLKLVTFDRGLRSLGADVQVGAVEFSFSTTKTLPIASRQEMTMNPSFYFTGFRTLS